MAAPSEANDFREGQWPAPGTGLQEVWPRGSAAAGAGEEASGWCRR